MKGTGFATNASIRGINQKTIEEIERYVHEKCKHLLLNSVYDETENQAENFTFLPGHATVILQLPSLLKELEGRTKKPSEINLNSKGLSFLMKELIKTAINNSSRDDKHHRFSGVIQNFAAYIFMLSGKSCYEILSQNLPLPQSSTICKFDHFFRCSQ